LLVPYLFWNTLAIVLFGLIGLIKPNLQSGATPPLQTWNLHVVASLYWSKSPDHIPIVPQFWFIRNLMVVVLFTPVIYWLVKKFNFLLPLVMGILWIMSIGDWDIPGTMCLFFFSLGAWFSIRKSSYVQVGTQLKYIGWFYPIFVVADFLTIGTSCNSYIHKVGILSGMIFWIWLLNKWLIKHENAKPKVLLLESTFFIFAAHEPYMGKFKTMMYHILPQISENHIVSDLQFVLYYFLIAAIWIAILIGIYGLIRKMSPKLAMFISGGR
jgi:hypothetical protein